MVSKYLVVLPESKGTLEEEWRQCLKEIIASENDILGLVKLNVFIDAQDFETFSQADVSIGESILSAFGDKCPAFNVTAHPPEKPWKVIVEAAYVGVNEGVSVVSKFLESTPYVIVSSENFKEVWAGGLGYASKEGNTADAAMNAFNNMRSILEYEQMSFNNIIRQWNFIGSILEFKNDNQNYQIFNKVRSDNYLKYRTVHSFPAATGVGMKFGGVFLDFFAVKSDNNLKLIAIDNPDQIRPYDYSQKVLKGQPAEGEKINQPPQFERAVYLVNNTGSALYVSGTASIIGQDTIGIGDIVRQTEITIENIGKLSDSERIGHLTGNKDFCSANLILLRVYIKNQSDFAKVKSICLEHFPDIPIVFIEADICRDNLLVEIEAEYSA